MLRSLPLISLKSLPENEQSNLTRKLLQRNNSLMVGHYSADDAVVFETSLPIEDGEITSKQLICCLSVVSNEIGYFRKQLTALTSPPADSVDSIDRLMRRLIDGDESKAE